MKNWLDLAACHFGVSALGIHAIICTGCRGHNLMIILGFVLDSDHTEITSMHVFQDLGLGSIHI